MLFKFVLLALATITSMVSSCEIPGTISSVEPIAINTPCWFNINNRNSMEFTLNKTSSHQELQLEWFPATNMDVSISWGTSASMFTVPVTPEQSNLWFEHDHVSSRDIYHCPDRDCEHPLENEHNGVMHVKLSAPPGSYWLRLRLEEIYRVINHEQLLAYKKFYDSCCTLTAACSPPVTDCFNIRGIECDSNGDVTMASFGLMGLVCTSDAVNNFMSALPALQILDIAHNKINGPLDDMDLHTSLRIINLQNNKFYGSIPCLPPHLIEFWGNLNKFSSPLKSCHVAHKQLHLLSISDNQNMAGQLTLEHYPNLRILIASFCGLTGELNMNKESTPLIESIELNFNHFHSKLPLILSDPPATLKAISLSYNHFEGNVPQFLRPILNVNLGGNHLTGPITESSFITYNNINAIVDISDNHLSGQNDPITHPTLLAHGNFFNCPSEHYTGKCVKAPIISGIVETSNTIYIYGEYFILSPTAVCVSDTGHISHFDRVNSTFGKCAPSIDQTTVTISNFYPGGEPSNTMHVEGLAQVVTRDAPITSKSSVLSPSVVMIVCILITCGGIVAVLVRKTTGKRKSRIERVNDDDEQVAMV